MTCVIKKSHTCVISKKGHVYIIVIKFQTKIFVGKVLENGSQEEVRVESGMWPQQLLLLQQSMNYLKLDQSFYLLLKLYFQSIFKLIFDPKRFRFQVEQLVYNSCNSSWSQRVLQQQCLTQIIQMVKKQILKFGQQFQQLEPEENECTKRSREKKNYFNISKVHNTSQYVTSIQCTSPLKYNIQNTKVRFKQILNTNTIIKQKPASLYYCVQNYKISESIIITTKPYNQTVQAELRIQ
ncbi:Hypothetical_protein [Hexamita inflata]|uniref:Hypothetical_protein n=1 Tax=Hexamita inflata TaxID=28002 RepID=A0AA86U631_9EUKA|nr:Hypothetical protein HINF_LOCUS28411 [Hexamita inflata]